MRSTGTLAANICRHAPQGPAVYPVRASAPSTFRITETMVTHRESEDSSFDWFKSYADVADIIRELIPEKSSKILMLGCGNSTLSQDVSVQYRISSPRT